MNCLYMLLLPNILRHQEAAVIQLDPMLMTITLVSIFVLFTLIFIASGVKVLKEWERVAILRFGKYLGVRGPGIIWRIPLIDRIGAKVSLRVQTVEIDTAESFSRDGTPASLVGEVRYRIVDLERAFLSLEDFQVTAQQSSRHVVIEQIESRDYNDLVANREHVESAIIKELDARFEKWGMIVVGVDLRVQKSNF
ncbi:MAG: SPFH domain-containing protein [Candidatus Thorarchaeota archaeon]